ncbi:MAG: hypothetical protein HY023_16360 [Chloroflexi bacterium]|nr:hypothetical protein [Chloroflexota bacterium]
MAGLIIWLAATAYLSLGPRYLPFDVIFNRIPFGQLVYTIRTPGKYLLFGEFSLAALSGVALREIALGLRAMRQKVTGFLPRLFLVNRRLALVMIAAVAGEMIFLSLQVNSLYPETWVGVEPGRKEYLDWLRANGDRTSRVLADPLGDLEVPALSGQPSFASHNEETPPSAGLYFEVSEAVRDDAKAHKLRPATRDLLYLLDVEYVALREPAPPDSGWLSGYDGEPYKIWRIAEHSPAVAARSLKPSADAADTSALIRNMHLNRPAKTAATIPVKASTAVPESESTGEQDPTPLGFIIKQYQVRLTSVTLDYQISAPAYLQLGYSAYPYLDVYLDGRPHESFSTALNLIGLATPAGEHRIELRPRLSPLRVIAYRLDVIGLVAIVVIAGWRRIFARFIPKRKA